MRSEGSRLLLSRYCWYFLKLPGMRSRPHAVPRLGNQWTIEPDPDEPVLNCHHARWFQWDKVVVVSWRKPDGYDYETWCAKDEKLGWYPFFREPDDDGLMIWRNRYRRVRPAPLKPTGERIGEQTASRHVRFDVSPSESGTRSTGLEPATQGLEIPCSIQLSYERLSH